MAFLSLILCKKKCVKCISQDVGRQDRLLYFYSPVLYTYIFPGQSVGENHLKPQTKDKQSYHL